MKKIIQILNKIFAPRQTTTIYYNDKKVGKLPKEAKETFDRMKKQMQEMNKMMDKMFED